MTGKAERTSITARLAIANLLRLADADLRDARVVMRGGSLRNAGMLLQSAVTRLTAACSIPEQGWSGEESRADTASLAPDNSMKARLQALEVAANRQPGLLPGGTLPEAPDNAALRDGIERAGDVLYALTEHFDVALDSDEPAGDASALRRAPAAEPPRPVDQPAPKAAPKTAPRPQPDGSNPSARVIPVPPRRPSDATKSRPAKVKPTAPAPPVASGKLAPSKRVASTVFWGLMERWGVADLDALVLLGHPGGLTQKGTRPRFKLSDAENDRMAQLQDIDAALQSLGLKAQAWLMAPIKEAPFAGASPMAFMLRGQAAGVHDLRQYLLNQGLRLSLQGGE